HPRGDSYLTHFRLGPFPVFTFSVGGLEIEKRVFMVQGENTVVVGYRMLNAGMQSGTLEIRPLVAFRDYHGTTHANEGLNRNVHSCSTSQATIAPYADLPALHFSHNAASLEPEGAWYYNF